MRVLAGVLIAWFVMTSTATPQRAPDAPGDTLRAAYLATNPAQAVKEPATGELRGVAVDMARELARRQGTTLILVPSPNPQAVMDAVQGGQADIGFVAYNPERAGPVAFSQPYLLVHQTFLVREDSEIRSVGDIDRAGQRIGGRAGDSIALYLARSLKQAQLVPLSDEETREAPQRVAAGTLDAFGANRQRLTDILRATSGVRLLPDDLYGVEQTIVVPRADAEGLKAVNAFIDDVRRSAFLTTAIRRSGVVGIAVAPPPR
jgi:polar amino acid transport system substrate-binding protein